MTDNQDNLSNLLYKLELLMKKQEDFSREINNLRGEIIRLKAEKKEQTGLRTETVPKSIRPASEPETQIVTGKAAKTSEPEKPGILHSKSSETPGRSIKVKSDLEKFIGENLINKIGIVITVIGVGIGAKYAIDNQLISPLTRIIIGYLVGAGLLGFAIKLKKNYNNFSAVLLSGSMAIIYFITYSAYSFYELMPQAPAFTLMVVFTAFTVVAAINYNRQVIALIGLVGAYAVPFLLSEGASNVEVLFSYMTIINIGILVIAFKKYWKPLYYSAFGLTWFIYVLWYSAKYLTDEYFTIALLFVSIFFSIFYLTFLAYKLLRKEAFDQGDILVLLVNSFIFYGLGYAILSDHETGQHFLGLFTLGNAIVHFIVTVAIFRQRLSDKSLLHLASGLVLVFITIAIPVQLDGNWVTLLWAGEAAVLFWVGRTRNVAIYEKLSYPLMLLAFFSLAHDWMTNYEWYYPEDPNSRIIPLLNIHFLSSMLFIAAFSFINILAQNKKYVQGSFSKKKLFRIMSYVMPALLILACYFSFRVEIANYWSQLLSDSQLKTQQEGNQFPDYFRNYDLNSFKTIWIINYSLLFISIMTVLNLFRIRNRTFGWINLLLTGAGLAVFVIQGLYEISELRESFLEQTLSQYYLIGGMNIAIRYISFLFVTIAVIPAYISVRREFAEYTIKVVFNFFLYTVVLWILSSELIHWMDMAESTQSYKIGLSILWGVYSLFLIVIGIWKKKKHLRIGAIALFAITLIKLFFYDISQLDTIAKTTVFVSLGVLLLVISFLYNKYKHLISDETDQ